MARIVILSLVFIFTNSSLFSQVSNVKLDHDVYSFLSKLSQKGIIEYTDLVKPLSRRYVAQKLVDAKNKLTRLTKLQFEELKFYEAEFGYEIERLKIEDRSKELEDRTQDSEYNKQNPEPRIEKQKSSFKTKDERTDEGETKKRDLLDKSWEFEVRNSKVGKENVDTANELYTYVEKDPYQRWRFFGYQNSQINLNVNPIMGYEIANWEKSNYQNLILGLNFRGEIGGILGFNFELVQTRESPRVKSFLYNGFSKNTAIDVQLADAERMEYATVNVDLGVNWEWGSFTIGKNHLNWGYAENGKIVLSEKSPSFPYIRLDIKPTEWLTFNYMHAWLKSDVVDTNSFYSSWRIRGNENENRFSYIQKFMAMHSVTFSFWDGVDLSLGESIIYADNLQLAYLIPIMFFDLADEYLSNDKNYAGSSTQLFLALSSRNHVKNTHFYGSFHADELTPEGLFDPATQYYKFAFTLGASTVDLPIENIGLRIEYTKVYPGNYRHFIPTLTYESSSALLGHWMGDNGDLFYTAIDYTVFRGLNFKLWTQYIRKGTEALGNRAYQIQIPQPGFLFVDNIHDRKNYTYYGIDVNYEIFHDLWVKAHFQYIDYEQQISSKEFVSKLNRDIAFSVGYGI
jgi:hypothetical protein